MSLRPFSKAKYTPDVKLKAAAALELRRRRAVVGVVSGDWRAWLDQHFAAYVSAGFAPRHEALWAWFAALEPGIKPLAKIDIWARGGAKCLDGDTEVLRADGTRIPIRDIMVGEPILSLHEISGEIVFDQIVDKIASGTKRCLRMTTRSGKSVRVTADHRVLTFEGWKRAGDLTLEDRIASPRYTRVLPYIERTDEEVRFLAYMLAEGGTSQGTRFTNADQVIVNDFMECAKTMGFSARKEGITHERYTYYVRGASDWVRAHGMRGCLSKDKRLPQWVYGLSERQKWIFLAAFIDTDGWIQVDRCRIGITLASKGLIDDLQYLFMQVGVVTSCYQKPNNKSGAWALVVAQEYIQCCIEKLPLLLKGERLRESATIPRYSLIDVYPASVCFGLPPGVNRYIRNTIGMRVGQSYDVTRGKLRRALSIVPLDKWKWLESADVFWDRVTKLEWDGECETFDVEVRRNHNLITNGLITHNSSSAELGAVYAGMRQSRRFVLYVSGAQAQADKHVQSIAGLLERIGIDRAVNRYNHSKGWTQQILRAANGFNVVSLGLDAGVRGVKLDQYRPDLIILDDVDNRHDSGEVVAKKIETLTESILPTGAPDYAVLFIQNKVHKDSIAAQLVDGRAAFLLNRAPLVIEPAIRGLAYEQTPEGTYRITDGEATWAGQSRDVCQGQINDWGLTAFLQEAQHEVDEPDGGMYSHLLYRRCRWADVPPLARICVWCDPAVTNTDSSDCHGIQADGIAADGTIYRLYSWEQRTSPQDVLRRAILKALELGAQIVGVETDQGGDTWQSVYHEAWRKLVEDNAVPSDAQMPAFRSAKAGAGHGSKVERGAKMLADYERGRFVHVEGTHLVLERALKRFPKAKPFDVHDACFIAGTQITTINGPIAIENIQSGMLVLTREGYKPVISAGQTKDNAELIKVEFTNGSVLIGTPNHPVWTENRGFVRLDALSWRDIIVSCQNEKQSSITGLHTFATPTHHTDHTGFITGRAKRAGGTYTKTSGQILTDLSQSIEDTKSIISTEIHRTTRRTIWSLLLGVNMPNDIGNSTKTYRNMRRCARKLLNGIGAPKVVRGIVSMVNELGKIANPAPLIVNTAEMPLILGMRAEIFGSARRDAPMPTMLKTNSVMKSEPAHCAAQPLLQSADTSSNIAHVRVRRVSKHENDGVWNLAVADCPEYFANGILVHNCYWSWHWLAGGGMGNSAVGAFLL